MKRFNRVLCVVSVFALCVASPLLSDADGPPPRDLSTPEARRLSASDASEYWDVTAEFEQGYWVMARFLITNQGPGEQNGTAVGHVIRPDGKAIQFQNGRLESGWELSKDGLDLDIGKSHLDLHGPDYRVKINKPDARIRLSFAPNALYRLPNDITGKRYEVDVLSLGAVTTGSIQLDGMAEPISVSGKTTLTHTIAKESESDLNLRRTELFYQRGDQPFYVTSFLHPRGMRSRLLVLLERTCDPTLLAPPESADTTRLGGSDRNATKPDESRCVRQIASITEFELSPRDANNGPAKPKGSDSYWIPPGYSLEGKGVEGRIQLGERILRHDPLDDLPGPIRFVAGLSTKPRRVWSKAGFDVRLPPTLNSEPIQFQGQGVAAVSFSNPVTRP